MEYIVISNKKVCGKVKDEKLTKDDILGAGGNIDFLIASGHIKTANAKKVTQAPQAPQEEPQVQQEETEAFVFNEYNEGDK